MICFGKINNLSFDRFVRFAALLTMSLIGRLLKALSLKSEYKDSRTHKVKVKGGGFF